ncbi:MAG: neutral/alkaline non-lysosomal ceramidase N-terminal domain-containing protein [Bacteroidetes bacterium]|nr:neutral/alkaline non-lysosomal ceramidase N-terminal domain-containing protein [Bacteroidota bacterium]
MQRRSTGGLDTRVERLTEVFPRHAHDQSREGLVTCSRQIRDFPVGRGGIQRIVSGHDLQDLGSVPHEIQREVVDRLRQRYGDAYGLANVVLSATHTHSGPGGYWHYGVGGPLGGKFYAAHFEAIVEGIVASIIQAHEDLGSLAAGANQKAHPPRKRRHEGGVPIQCRQVELQGSLHVSLLGGVNGTSGEAYLARDVVGAVPLEQRGLGEPPRGDGHSLRVRFEGANVVLPGCRQFRQ